MQPWCCVKHMEAIWSTFLSLNRFSPGLAAAWSGQQKKSTRNDARACVLKLSRDVSRASDSPRAIIFSCSRFRFAFHLFAVDGQQIAKPSAIIVRFSKKPAQFFGELRGDRRRFRYDRIQRCGLRTNRMISREVFFFREGVRSRSTRARLMPGRRRAPRIYVYVGLSYAAVILGHAYTCRLC